MDVGEIVQTFYDGLLYPKKTKVNLAAGGKIGNKSEEEALQIIEDIAENEQWDTGREQPQRKPAKAEVSVLDTIMSKFDELNTRIDNMTTPKVNSVAAVVCDLCGDNSHSSENCDLLDSQTEQVNYVNYN